jgi:hypothetical protein
MIIRWCDLNEDTQRRFSMNNLVDIGRDINEDGVETAIDNSSCGPTHYTIDKIDYSSRLTSRFECGAYGAVDTWIYLALQKYSIKDMNVCVFGSTEQGFGPWYESMVLNMGGIPITTDYNEVKYDSIRYKFWSIDTLKENIKSGFKFDYILNISSIEHDGLGRYGDPINPDGDLETMSLLRSYLKPNGLMFLTVPVGSDAVMFNHHRIYGVHRLPKLLDKWLVLDSFGYSDELLTRDTRGGWVPLEDDGTPMFEWYPAYEPLFVLKNINPL